MLSLCTVFFSGVIATLLPAALVTTAVGVAVRVARRSVITSVGDAAGVTVSVTGTVAGTSVTAFVSVAVSVTGGIVVVSITVRSASVTVASVIEELTGSAIAGITITARTRRRSSPNRTGVRRFPWLMRPPAP